MNISTIEKIRLSRELLGLVNDLKNSLLEGLKKVQASRRVVQIVAIMTDKKSGNSIAKGNNCPYNSEHKGEHSVPREENNMSFLDWYNDADMPSRDKDGTWVDLETGLPFSPAKPKGKSTKVTNAKALEARDIAKAFGGKALTGSAKQKTWAEQIRADFIKNKTEDEIDKFVTSGSFLNTAKFWIENRGKTFDFEDVIKSLSVLNNLKSKHYDVLARQGSLFDKENAKKEIMNAIKSNKVFLVVSFPNFDPYAIIADEQMAEARKKKYSWAR